MLTLVRRVVAAFGLTGLIAMLFRLRGRGGVPPQRGGWRQLTEAELVDFLDTAPETTATAGSDETRRDDNTGE